MFSSLNEQTGRADVAQMPDLIHVVGQCFQIFGEMIVRVGEDKDPQRFAIHLRSFLPIRRGITIL